MILKKYIILFVATAIYQNSFSQLFISNGAQWTNSGTAIVTLQNIDFVNNGLYVFGKSVTRFTGSSNNTISGSSVTNFYDLEVEKTGSNKITLLSNVQVGHRVNFNDGLLDLNQRLLTLADTALLVNENENSRITGINGGEVVITLNASSPNNLNPGNLGAAITSAANLGTVTIRRGHKVQGGSGLPNSINRYFAIQAANNSNLDAALRFFYFDAELNTENESTLNTFESFTGGLTWTNQSYTSANTGLNYVEKTGIGSFSRWTLSGQLNTLPVTGLGFTARRINNAQVQLNWKTIQEINNKGFHIERKNENEGSFTDIGFTASSASGGNSSFPLQYQETDNNNFTGKTFYRIKQEDMDGRSTYSVIRIVNGDAKQAIMQVWPVPSTGSVNVLVGGLPKADKLMVFDASGKLVQQLQVQNNAQVQLAALPAGIYMVRLAEYGELMQKIIVQ